MNDELLKNVDVIITILLKEMDIDFEHLSDFTKMILRFNTCTKLLEYFFSFKNEEVKK